MGMEDNGNGRKIMGMDECEKVNLEMCITFLKSEDDLVMLGTKERRYLSRSDKVRRVLQTAAEGVDDREGSNLLRMSAHYAGYKRGVEPTRDEHAEWDITHESSYNSFLKGLP